MHPDLLTIQPQCKRMEDFYEILNDEIRQVTKKDEVVIMVIMGYINCRLGEGNYENSRYVFTQHQ